MPDRMSVPELHEMKRRGDKIVGVVAWDYQAARIADAVGVDIVSVGDSVGVNLWGHDTPFEVTTEEMLVVARAVRRGTQRALVSCDFPFGPLQQGTDCAVATAIRFVKEAGADLVKLDGAADYLDAVRAIVRAGIPVFAQLGVTPQSALRLGFSYQQMASSQAEVLEAMADKLVAEAVQLEEAGAALLDFTNSGEVVGPLVAAAVSIPVLGGFGGGPWLDGRVRMVHAAIGYAASNVDTPSPSYANVAQITSSALAEYAADVRSGRHLRGAPARTV